MGRVRDWRSGGFIDLVLARDRDSVRLVIECKRSTRGQWIFFDPAAERPSTGLVRSLATLNKQGGDKEGAWVDCALEPRSAESSFCESARIDLTTGHVAADDVSFRTAPLMRFRKALTPRVDPSRFKDLHSVKRDAERTVLVINASALPDGLREFRSCGILPESPRARLG